MGTYPTITKSLFFDELGSYDLTDLISLRRNRDYLSNLTGVDTRSVLFAAGTRTIKEEGLEGIDLIVGSAEELPFADNSADAVMAWRMLYEIDPRRGLAEAWRILRPGGLLLFSAFNEDNIETHRLIELFIS